jgi:hypothetical protein
MKETDIAILTAIQSILAPALGISAVGLLLLGLMSRYSNIIGRIRSLNDERRKLTRSLSEEEELSYAGRTRLMSVTKQSQELLARSQLVRNAILSMQISIGLFVLTSVAIALNLFADAAVVRVLPLVLFILGLLTVFVGIVFSAIEVHRSFRIVLLEVKGEE